MSTISPGLRIPPKSLSAPPPIPFWPFAAIRTSISSSSRKTIQSPKLSRSPVPDANPVFSPDGKQLAFQTALAQPYYYYANGHIAVVELSSVLNKAATTPADVHDLTAKFDEDPYPIDWGPDGIYFGAEQKTSAHIFRANPQTDEIQRVTSPDNLLLEEGSFTRDFKTVAYVAEDPTHMAELFVSTTAPFAPKKLTDMTAQVKDWNLGTSEVISWKSQDGAVIEGILRKPADYDPARKYPSASSTFTAAPQAHPSQPLLLWVMPIPCSSFSPKAR